MFYDSTHELTYICYTLLIKILFMNKKIKKIISQLNRNKINTTTI